MGLTEIANGLARASSRRHIVGRDRLARVKKRGDAGLGGWRSRCRIQPVLPYAFALLTVFALGFDAHAADPSSCFAVSDGSNPDRLVSILRTGSPTADIGSAGSGITNIEAITLSLDSDTLYAANQFGSTGQFGTMNQSTGAFSLIGNIGAGTGALGSITFADVDGLAIDPWTGVFYGSVRREGDPSSAFPDVLIQIDPVTGSFVPDAFGTNIDYVVIDTGGAVGLDDVDDISIDPADGQMYAVANNGGGNDRLVRVDKATGAVTDVNRLRLADGTVVTDMEGFSFANDGVFFGTTGTNSTVAAQRNRLWQIDKATGIVTLLGQITGSDHESVACLTAGSNKITGTVYRDLDADGILDGGELGQEGVTVRLYIDNNNDGQVDAGDTLIDTTATAVDGTYGFEVAIVGDFVVDIDSGSLPADSGLTTDNIETASFTTYDNVDANNDFGFAPSADLAIVKTASADPVSSGETLTYTLTVTNDGPASATDVVINDALPPAVTWVSTTPSQGSCSSPSGVTCELGTIANGGTASVTIVVTVN